MTAGTIDGRIVDPERANRAAAAVLWAHGALWQRAVLMRLDRLGWTQQEMGEVTGISQGEVAKTLFQIAEVQNGIKKTLDSGIPHSEVAERFNLPLQLI